MYKSLSTQTLNRIIDSILEKENISRRDELARLTGLNKSSLYNMNRPEYRGGADKEIAEKLYEKFPEYFSRYDTNDTNGGAMYESQETYSKLLKSEDITFVRFEIEQLEKYLSDEKITNREKFYKLKSISIILQKLVEDIEER